MNGLKLDIENGKIIVGAAFAKKCSDPSSQEYKAFQNLTQQNPEFEVMVHRIKKNTKKESYKGLTYAYMEDYIRRHEEGKKQDEVLAEYSELRLIAECHSTGHRYPTIKKWFLAKYPEVSGFGAVKEDGENQKDMQTESQSASNGTLNITVDSNKIDPAA